MASARLLTSAASTRPSSMATRSKNDLESSRVPSIFATPSFSEFASLGTRFGTVTMDKDSTKKDLDMPRDLILGTAGHIDQVAWHVQVLFGRVLVHCNGAESCP